MTIASFLHEILFVIVLYKKRARESDAFNSITDLSNGLGEGISIFIYDNSPEADGGVDKNVIYRHDRCNSGVSKAYNEGFRIAQRQNKKWLLLLDQDTTIEAQHVTGFYQAVDANSNSVAFVPKLHDQLGIVSPFKWSRAQGKRIKHVERKLRLDEYRFANSGLLIDVNAFSIAGGYEEEIPLDFSDISFGEKLKRATDHFVVVDADVKHSFSGSLVSPLKDSAVRFRYFCLGAFQMGRLVGPFLLYYVRALLRGLHLSFRHKNMTFIKTFFEAQNG